MFSFSSSGYLDVSVHRVPSVNLWIQLTVHTLRMWVPPFRDLRIFVYVPLPAAFRSLSRLSSALSAKASALCSWCFFSVMTYRSQPSSIDGRYSVTDHLLFCLNLLGYHSKISDVFLLFFVRYSVFGFQGANAGLNRLTGFCSQDPDGDGEIRTHDPLLARQVLSQLSYTPDGIFSEVTFCIPLHPNRKNFISQKICFLDLLTPANGYPEP